MGGPGNGGAIVNRRKQRLGEVVDVKRAFFLPIGVVTKAVDPNIMKAGIIWEPLLGPVQRGFAIFGPRTSRATPQAMNEDQISYSIVCRDVECT